MKRPTRSKPEPAEAEESRQRILRAAFQAFSEKGYAGASTLLIATRAKVSKRDLYVLFPNKEAMLVACITSRSQRMRIHAGLPEPEDRQKLASALEAFATNFLSETLHPDVIGMYRLAVAEAVRSPEVAQMLEDGRQANRAALYDLFVQAQGKGLLPSGDTAEMVRDYLAITSEDLILNLLLRVQTAPTRAQIRRRAAKSAAQFLLMHPAEGSAVPSN